MEINTINATKHFFPNTSLEYVYFEAVANALDAKATKIEISVEVESFDKPKTLKISIKDNGVGFNDENFRKFNKLLETEDYLHKGVGRLVFITYFSRISISSNFNTGYRNFVFSESYDSSKVKTEDKKGDVGSTLIFENYQKDTIKTYDYISLQGIKDKLLNHFYPKFYELKKSNTEFEISIKVKTNVENPDKQFFNGTVLLTNQDIEDLKEKEINSSTDFFDKYKLSYSVMHDYNLQEPVVTIALCADGRTLPYNEFSLRDFPKNYKMIFLLESLSFNGKTEANRESLILDDSAKKQLKKDFASMIKDVLKEEIPDFENTNNDTKESIRKFYPHLDGFFDEDVIGFLDKHSVIQDAQEKFFAAQRKILEADNLTEAQYNESLDQASRVLTEYVLYRNKIISKMKEITKKDDESVIHNLILPKKKVLKKNQFLEDVFNNNIWLLDDKFMTYSIVISDREMEEIYTELKVTSSYQYDENEKSTGRPDITIIFSKDPNEENTNPVDVVIVELKKINLKLAKKEEVTSQLKQRARRLYEFYPNKIQRMWFYGIIDFDTEFKAFLREEDYTKIFSSGEIFYKKQKIAVGEKDFFADFFLLSYETMVSDAEDRNETFLKVLKNAIRASVESRN